MNRVDLSDGSAWFDLDSCVRYQEKDKSSNFREALYYTSHGNWVHHTWESGGFNDKLWLMPEKKAIAWLILNGYEAEAANYSSNKWEI